MKNKVLIRALIASLFAFMLYSAGLRQVKNAKVSIVEPKSSKVTKKQTKEPKIRTNNNSNKQQTVNVKDVTVKKGSQKSLVEKIEKAMGSKNQYQVSVQDLNNPSRFASLGTSDGVHEANGAMRLFILTTIYHLEQSGKLKHHTTIKINKEDRVKGEKMLQVNMMYGVTYLRQAMMHGNKTAANALLRKVKVENVNKFADKMGATNTAITGSFKTVPVGKTSVSDLETVMKKLYQNKGLNRQYSQLALGGLQGAKSKLTQKVSGTIYCIDDRNFTSAIVQSGGHSYCITVWSDSQANFSKLGTAVNNWFMSNR